MDPIGNKTVLGQFMSWHQTGNKPLPEPMMTKFRLDLDDINHTDNVRWILSMPRQLLVSLNDAYECHQGLPFTNMF